MNNTLNQRKLFMIAFLAFGISCENEYEFETHDNQQTEIMDQHPDSPNENLNLRVKQNFIGLKEIPSIQDYLSAKLGSKFLSRDIQSGGAIFDTDSILQTIDSLDNTTYSFHFALEEGASNEFYNLYLGIDACGNRSEPMVIKYTLDPNQMDSFYSNGYDFKRYNGKIAVHRYTDFFDQISFSKQMDCETQFDEFGDPIPCVENDVSLGGSGGAASGSGQGGGGQASSGGGPGGNLYTTISCNCVGHNTSQIASGACSCSSFSVVVFDMDNSRPLPGDTGMVMNNTIGDCADCASGTTGNIGINLAMAARISSQVNKLDNILGLSLVQKSFLNLPANYHLTELINAFWRIIDFDARVDDYVKEVIDANINETGLSTFPLVKYPASKVEEYKSEYPKFTEYLTRELPKIASNQKVIDVINDLTEAPKDVIKEALQWGKGPEIRIEQLGGVGDNEKLGAYRGHLNPTLEDVLFLDVDLVRKLENETNLEFSDALEFLIGVTILHEYTHLGDFVFGNNFWGDLWLDSAGDPENEAGLLFEETVFGESVFISNAGVVLKRTGGL